MPVLGSDACFPPKRCRRDNMAESDQVHNYAYPSVASWIHSTSLAQLDDSPGAAPSHAGDEHDASPDDFYKTPYSTSKHTSTSTRPDLAPPPSFDMATSRLRQPTTRAPPPKSTPRSVSGPASSTATTRSSPQVSNKVKALAERFERSPGGGVTSTSTSTSTAPAVRSRSREPFRAGAYDPAKRSHASVSSTASKEAAYGSYKFNNLKPRERPQPAPAIPRNPPATRRTTGSRSSVEQQMSPSRKTMTTPVKKPAAGGRQPFFGEVVGGQDVTSPGFGIPTFDDDAQEEATGVDAMRLPATTFSTPQHERTFAGEEEYQSPSARQTPVSRIPVRARRLSGTSDTSSSRSSVKYTPTRPSNHSNRASPTRFYRKPVGDRSAAAANGADLSTLPALAYRGHREHSKTPVGSRDALGVAAIANAPPPPASPRLRNSRERQPLQPSPGVSSRDSGTHEYFPDGSFASHQAPASGFEQVFDAGSRVRSQAHPHETSSQNEHHPREEHQKDPEAHQQRLSLQTSHLSVPPMQQPLSATTDFEESPVLGIPGSFVLTPPTAHEEAQPQLLQPTVFRAAGRKTLPRSPDLEQSELGVRESIPIMLGSEQSPPEDVSESLQPLTRAKSVERNHGSNGIWPASQYSFDDSPHEPFSNRNTLHPDDSASIAPYRTVGPVKFSSETYSVVNSVLNMYHQSPVISPELAFASRSRVQQVSPVIAQHKDWGSKEATETYLARLLSDANGVGEAASRSQETTPAFASCPATDFPTVDEEAHGLHHVGTAIVYPPSSRRHSHGSRGSTTTTIQDDASRSGSSSGKPSRDLSRREQTTDSAAASGIELPQLAWTNGGLGLSYHENMSPSLSPTTQHVPPRPAYSPPLPPTKPSIDEHAIPSHATQPPFSHHYPQPPETNEQIEVHPARVHTPVSQPNEQSLAARYTAPRPMKDGDQASIPRGATENGQPGPAKQALIKRYRILEELLTTEHQFCIDMMIAHNIFEATAQSLMTEKEKKILFSNCKDLEKFSHSLFRAFKKAAKPIVNYDIPSPTGPWNRDSSDSRPSESSLNLRRPSEDSQNQFENCTIDNDHLTTIGQVFLENAERMERLYTTYFLNQDNAATYMKKHGSNPELTGWVSACFEQVENMTQAWDLDSLLLKPCQRLLKYPLLLDGLENSSDPDHPDLPNIKAARKELLAVSARINEAKKRADTFRAATSEGKKEKTKGKGIGKTFVKAFIPKVDKNKAYDEADKTFKDQDYKSREQKFGGHFFQLQIVIRDFEQYLDAITEHYQQLNIVFLGFVTVSEVAPSVHPELESTWRKWAMAHFELQNKALEDHVSNACAVLFFR